jgi:hypothetical protein
MGHLNRFNLQSIIDTSNTKILVETGTGTGSSLRYALSYPFEKIYSIEIMAELQNKNIETFSKHSNCILINKSSKEGLIEALHYIPQDQNILFFLDAHFPGTDDGTLAIKDTQDKDLRIPLECELEVIKKIRDISNDVFIIDDLRIYEDNNYEHGNWSGREIYGGNGIDFIYNLFGDTHIIRRDLRDEGYILLTPKSQHKFNKVIFFNHGHLGDTIISKPFISQIKTHIPSQKYIISNAYDNSYTSDILDEHIPLNQIPISADTWIAEDEENNILYFNTWFGALNQSSHLEQLGLSQKDRQDLKSKDNILYNWENYFFFFNINLKIFNSKLDISYMLDNKTKYVLPSPKLDIDIPLLDDKRIKILIYNQQATSGQADNEDFTPYIKSLIQNKNIIIYTSQPTNLSSDNLVSLSDYISYPDLFKISYLSTFCNYICGPGNAPLQTTWVKENILDKNKTYIVINRNDPGEAILFKETLSKNIVVNSTKELFGKLNELL